jgi:hypothetical protein
MLESLPCLSNFQFEPAGPYKGISSSGAVSRAYIFALVLNQGQSQLLFEAFD